MVLILKTPAIWNKKDNLPVSPIADDRLSEENPLEITPELNSLFKTDLYIMMSKSICEKLELDELHIVQGFSSDEKRNWINAETAGRYTIDDKITYWCITESTALLPFLKMDIVFTRGNYERLHTRLFEFIDGSGQRPIWLHYPATAMMFPHVIKHNKRASSDVVQSSYEHQIALREQVNGMYVEHDIRSSDDSKTNDTQEMLEILNSKFMKMRKRINKGPYDIVLVDDISSVEEYSIVYPNSIISRFVKPNIDINLNLNFERKYDIIFCGTTLQKTKNHMQFITLLNRLDEASAGILKIAIAGNQGDMTSFSEGLTGKYQNLIIDDFGQLSKSQLLELFNDSKTMVVLSGRDSNPRVIQEAGGLGVRTIVADTMSDGLEILRDYPLIGAVVPTEKTTWFYSRNGNLKFDVDSKFAENVLKEIKLSKSPIVVANICKSLYDFDTSLLEIIELIRSLS